MQLPALILEIYTALVARAMHGGLMGAAGISAQCLQTCTFIVSAALAMILYILVCRAGL